MDLSTLKNIVRIGTVGSVDLSEHTARVIFTDKNNLVSGPLIVLQNQPKITPISTQPEKTDEGNTEKPTEEFEVTPWLPFVGQSVVCLYLPNGESDGFVIGGI